MDFFCNNYPIGTITSTLEVDTVGLLMK